MTQYTDPQIDALIAQTLARQAAVKRINRQVMKQLRRERRRSVVRQWAAVVAFSFLMPLSLCLLVWLFLSLHADGTLSTPIAALGLLPAAAIIVTMLTLQPKKIARWV